MFRNGATSVIHRCLLGLLLVIGHSLPARAKPRLVPDLQPSANASDMPALADLLDRTGWLPTPELSGIFQVGSIFSSADGPHVLMLRGCFEAEASTDTYTSLDLTSQLQAGVRVRGGMGAGALEGALVKHLKFGLPEHHAMARLAMTPSAVCAERLGRLTADQRRGLYAVQEVLTAEIAEQTCGRLDASGRFVGLGGAELELARACSQVSLEPVAVAYRVVPLADLSFPDPPASDLPATGLPALEGCPWGRIQTVSSSMTTLTINGETRGVRGIEARSAISADLQRCDRAEAARAFDLWRAHRRATNIAGATLVGFWPFGIGIYTAWNAGNWRERMEQLLLDPTVADQRSGGWRKQVRSPGG